MQTTVKVTGTPQAKEAMRRFCKEYVAENPGAYWPGAPKNKRKTGERVCKHQ